MSYEDTNKVKFFHPPLWFNKLGRRGRTITGRIARDCIGAISRKSRSEAQLIRFFSALPGKSYTYS